MAIAYIPHRDIDITKWDACLALSKNKVIYAQRFYLDQMASHWDALVLNDYEAIMPLTWKKKWGIRYIYQPAFIQQGGVFSKNKLDEDTMSAFISTAAEHFRFAEFTGNTGVTFPASSGYELETKLNYALNLSASYHELSHGYDSITKKNLKRALNSHLEYNSSADYNGIIKFYQQQYETRLPAFDANDYKKFGRLCNKLAAENNLICRTVSKHGAGIIAGVVLLRNGNRLYNLVSAVNAEGKNTQASYLLYDKLIEEFASQPLVLDFEGSDVPGIAGFYRRFNPAAEYYQFVRFNNLPALLKLFK